jgi:hypothetical protein
MASDLMFILPYQPGTLWRLTDAIASAGVSIEGCSAQAFGPEGMIHILVEDALGARRAAEGAGFAVSSEREVIVAPVEHRPGALAALLRPIADAGVDVNLVYLTRTGSAVIGVAPDDLPRARSAMGLVAG